MCGAVASRDFKSSERIAAANLREEVRGVRRASSCAWVEREGAHTQEIYKHKKERVCVSMSMF